MPALTHAPAPRPARRRAAISTEYVLILALVVIPLALLVPTLTRMIVIFTGRIATMIRLPVG